MWIVREGPTNCFHMAGADVFPGRKRWHGCRLTLDLSIDLSIKVLEKPARPLDAIVIFHGGIQI